MGGNVFEWTFTLEGDGWVGYMGLYSGGGWNSPSGLESVGHEPFTFLAPMLLPMIFVFALCRISFRQWENNIGGKRHLLRVPSGS